ncbi:MAG TPA: ribosome silencing factor [Candidatus Binataceae bacterium]|nr:ribosome silencing factor [Candidatus Binataceae bacterium]
MDSLTKTLAVVEAALEKKAYDLRVVQIEHLSSIAEYFVIATGRSDVQVQGIARGVEERMDREGERALAVEGVQRAHWIVLDYDDVVIHVFFEPTRDFYRLESNWSDTQEVPLPEPFLSQVRELRSRASG